MVLQGAMSEVLGTVVESLHVSDAHFNHTGDGYVCTFAGDSSARVLEFVNALFPELRKRMAPFGQLLRGGLAFGLVHFRKDSLTNTDTHFDLPGIEAARLEHAAQPGQILSTLTVHSIFARHYPKMFSDSPLDVQTKDRILVAYEVTPGTPWNALIKQRLTDYLYKRSAEGTSERPGYLLVVDDQPRMAMNIAHILAKSHPKREVIMAFSAEEALKKFERMPCALVVTDIVMEGVSGVELTRRVRERVPDQMVVGISAYSSNRTLTEFYQAGGFAFLSKAVDSEELAKTAGYVLSEATGRAFETQLATMCDDVVAFKCAADEVTGKLEDVLRSVGSGTLIAQALLRHKAKHLINEGIARLGPGVEPVVELRQLAIQLACVERLARVVGRLGVQKLGAFLAALIADLRRLYPLVTFTLIDDVGADIEGELQIGGVVVLAIVELLDNAAAAVGARGRVQIEIVGLKAAGMLQVTVTDSGPGVPSKIEGRMFDENVSTKGPGRGIGLHLVREAVRLLRGSITYEQRDGSVFCVRLPLTA